VAPLVAVLNDLRPRVEQAVKSGAVPLIIGGDCSIALATVAGARRYYRHVGLVYVDRDADLNVPATSHSGCVDGMVISHAVGRGAPELVRFWGEPPLVRESDVVLFGIDRVDPPEDAALNRSPMRRFRAEEIRRKGAAESARAAIRQLHSGQNEFILHVDVDVISSSEFPAASFAAEGGLPFADVREALKVFVAEKNLAAIEISTYNPSLDPEGKNAAALIELICDLVTTRAEAFAAAAASAAAASSAATEAAPAAENAAASEPPKPSEASSGPAATIAHSGDEATSPASGMESVSPEESARAASSMESPTAESPRESAESVETPKSGDTPVHEP
jgi:arginase